MVEHALDMSEALDSSLLSQHTNSPKEVTEDEYKDACVTLLTIVSLNQGSYKYQ